MRSKFCNKNIAICGRFTTDNGEKCTENLVKVINRVAIVYFNYGLPKETVFPLVEILSSVYSLMTFIV
jgi:hypothetical protein